MNKFKQALLKFYHSYAWVVILLLFIDQATKLWAYKQKWDFVVIPNFFSLIYIRNTGAAWSIFSNSIGVLATISAVTGIGIIVARIVYRNKLDIIKKVLIAVILAGTWGNFIDRAFYKLLLGSEGVVDFLAFQFGSYSFPIFNVADICVVVGIIGLIIYLSLEDAKFFIEFKAKRALKKEKEKMPEVTENGDPN